MGSDRKKNLPRASEAIWPGALVKTVFKNSIWISVVWVLRGRLEEDCLCWFKTQSLLNPTEDLMEKGPLSMQHLQRAKPLLNSWQEHGSCVPTDPVASLSFITCELGNLRQVCLTSLSLPFLVLGMEAIILTSMGCCLNKWTLDMRCLADNLCL